MASPIYDALSVQHSRNIRDTVAAAATNGTNISSAQRDIHLNNACRIWMKLKFLAKDWNALRPVLGNATGTLSTATITLSAVTGGVLKIRKLLVTNTTLYVVNPVPDELLGELFNTTTQNSFVAPSATRPLYTIRGSTLTVYPTASFASNAYTMEYVKQHVALSAGGATDILIEKDYHDEILSLAYIESEKEKADPTSIERIKLLTNPTITQEASNY